MAPDIRLHAKLSRHYGAPISLRLRNLTTLCVFADFYTHTYVYALFSHRTHRQQRCGGVFYFSPSHTHTNTYSHIFFVMCILCEIAYERTIIYRICTRAYIQGIHAIITYALLRAVFGPFRKLSCNVRYLSIRKRECTFKCIWTCNGNTTPNPCTFYWGCKWLRVVFSALWSISSGAVKHSLIYFGNRFIWKRSR